MWLYVPSLSLPDAEAWTSPSDSQLQTISQSATWRTKSLRPASWRRVLRMEASLRHLSGLISDPSAAQRGVDTWISSLADSLVPTSPSLASRPESMENTPACGLSTSESFAKCNPDGSLSRTFRQLSLIPQEELYSEGLPSAGSMRSGELFERPTLARHTSGKDASSWPSPDAALMNDGADPERHALRVERLKSSRINGNGAGTPLAMKAQMWPTASSEDAECAGNHPGATDSLTGATKEWRTPNTRDHHAQGPRTNHPQRQTTLVDQVQWQTPATDSFRSRGGDRKDEMGLD